MNIALLDNIKLVEGHTLSILVINQNLEISNDELRTLKGLGNVTIAVETPIELSFLLSRLSGMGFSIVLLRRVPILNYDVLISNKFDDITKIIVKNLKIKYLCFTQFIDNFSFTNYHEFEENSYRLVSVDGASAPTPTPSPLPPPPVLNEDQETIISDENVVDNDESNYNAIIADVASTNVKYDKYELNYLKAVVPGKISIIMIVSVNNNNFAEVIRSIKAQNLPSIEFIIIDNAAGFRNNVKPNIRYGEKMPLDYCKYHAKELASGEYMIILDQDAKEFDVMTAINQGQYETR